MEETIDNMLLIMNYYSEAIKYINDGNYKDASKVLYKEMPFDLYDMSLNILFNRNEIFSDEKLKKIIQEVDDKMVIYLTINKEDDLLDDEKTIIF